MQPLCFSEFVQFFDDTSDKMGLFQKFLRYGGFPEATNMLVHGAEVEIPDYLLAIYNTVLEKDIKKRKQIRNMDDFRRVYLYCLDNIGSITSPNRIAGVLNDAGRTIDRKTVNEYLQTLTDCYLLYPTERYDIRGKEILRAGEKYYTVDLGLADVLLERPSTANLGHRLENIVFLELNKRYGNVRIGKNYDKEIDFVVKNRDGEIEYYQVSQTISDEFTLERELASLKNTGDHYRKTILTMDPLETNEKGIACCNLIDWLLLKNESN
jgi:predicted AAA+ superfamily ATPase